MILVIDNYDSFTYNLVQYLKQLNYQVLVKRNDQITIPEIIELNPDMILLSPGPGKPSDAKLCHEIIMTLGEDTPILGVCLGHQVIVEAFGGRVLKGKQPMHGKVARINHDKKGVFMNLPTPLNVTRYHSLVADNVLPNCLEVSAETIDGEIMAVRHTFLPIEGIQFHPESIMTEYGLDMLQNFILQYTMQNKGETSHVFN